MIQAILKRKVQLIPNEDTLTSSVFDHLKLLPSELLWDILFNSCYQKNIQITSSKLLSIEYWPRWNSEETINTSFVEPDVFLRFQNVDIIIEAKRWDSNQQDRQQWEREISAYLKEYEGEKRQVLLVALGGIRNKNAETISIGDTDYIVFKCKWSNMLEVIIKVQTKLRLSDTELEYEQVVITILETIIQCFAFHGFFVGEWLETLDFDNYKIENYEKVSRTLNQPFRNNE